MPDVDYQISTYPSKGLGYQSKKGQTGQIKAFISRIWEEAEIYTDSFDRFMDGLIYILMVERICLERAFQRIRMKNRCDPCKMHRYAILFFEYLYPEEIEKWSTGDRENGLLDE